MDLQHVEMDLQHVTDELVAGISRPVALVGGDDRPIAVSGKARPGARVRATIPIRGRERDIASFRLFDDGTQPISASDYALLDAASSMVRDLLDVPPGETGARIGAAGQILPSETVRTSVPDRETIQHQLLDDDEAVRRQAFQIAVRNRWVDRAAKTAVRAVLLDPSVGTVRRLALARNIASTSHTNTLFIGEVDGCLHFLTRDPEADAGLDERVAALAARFGATVTAIGASVVTSGDADLAPAARQARSAAELTAALPELQPVGWYEQLGHWVLLSQIAPGSVRMAEISPAAEVLYRPGNEVYRETVEAYLDAAGRNSVACERLHIHRTTLYYRLDNAPAVVREALKDGFSRSSLHLAIKLHRLWSVAGAV